MPSVTSSVENLVHSVWQILGGVFQSVMAVFSSIIALAQNLVQAVISIVVALVSSITSLMSGVVGFVVGAYISLRLKLDLWLMMLIGNLFIILVLGGAYWFYTTQTATGKRRTSGPGAKKVL